MSRIYDKYVDNMIYDKHANSIKFHIESFASASELISANSKRTITDLLFADEAKREPRPHFTGVKDYQEALTLLKKGYQLAVDKMRGELKAAINGQRTRFAFHNEIVGFAPVVPLVMRGVPECMVNMHMTPIKSKVVDLYYDCVESAHVDKNDLMNSGKIILSAITELEMQGYRLNLYCMQGYADRDSCDMLVVKVKSDSQPIDLKRISFPLAHPAFFRVIGFDWYSKFPGGKYRPGYGHSLRYLYDDEKIGGIYKSLFGNNAIVLTGYMVRRKGKSYVKEVIENAGKNSKTRQGMAAL